ncbi:MAG: hypothetical protein JRG71_14715 [Deltaproteobacteria bacterium]|nr:hypothetical protein [Deltaproteobacteria bacterium]
MSKKPYNPKNFTKKQIEICSKSSKSYRDMLLLLHVGNRGENYTWLKGEIEKYNINVSHFFPYSKDNFTKICKKSFSIAEVLENLGLTKFAGNHRIIRRKVLEFGIDISHWTGQYGQRKWKQRKSPYTLEDILVENSSYSGSRLLKRLVKRGILELKCVFDDCPTRSLKSWRKASISYELDHMNGISNDHRLINLRILCVMCHKQTKNYGGKNKSIIIKPPEPICIDCGVFVNRYGYLCLTCSGKKRTTIDWPDPEVLLGMVNKNGLSATSRVFACAVNSVKKRLKKSYPDWKSDYFKSRVSDLHAP